MSLTLFLSQELNKVLRAYTLSTKNDQQNALAAARQQPITSQPHGSEYSMGPRSTLFTASRQLHRQEQALDQHDPYQRLRRRAVICSR